MSTRVSRESGLRELQEQDMKITRRDFKWAIDHGLIEPGPAERLWQALAAHVAHRPKFDLTYVAYYAGAMVVILAMTWFMTEAWNRYGELGLLVLAIVYGAAFAYTGATLWPRPGMRVPAGLLVTIAVCMVPLAIFAVQALLGLWPDTSLVSEYVSFHFRIQRSFVFMELGVIVAALVALRFVRFPFLVMPVAVALYYMAMDMPALIYGPEAYTMFDHQWISLWFGLGVLLVAYLVDRRTREDYAFWLYIFGTLTFFGGLSLLIPWDLGAAAAARADGLRRPRRRGLPGLPLLGGVQGLADLPVPADGHRPGHHLGRHRVSQAQREDRGPSARAPAGSRESLVAVEPDAA
jgi:hypothetical protein